MAIKVIFVLFFSIMGPSVSYFPQKHIARNAAYSVKLHFFHFISLCVVVVQFSVLVNSSYIFTYDLCLTKTKHEIVYSNNSSFICLIYIWNNSRRIWNTFIFFIGVMQVVLGYCWNICIQNMPVSTILIGGIQCLLTVSGYNYLM